MVASKSLLAGAIFSDIMSIKIVKVVTKLTHLSQPNRGILPLAWLATTFPRFGGAEEPAE
jgi:hypothetical protein